MEIKNEVPFAGKMYNGFAMLFFNLFMYVAGILLIVAATAIDIDLTTAVIGGVLGGLVIFINFFVSFGFLMIEPGEARVMLFFGKYRGTYTQSGYYWCNPFYSVKKLSFACAQP